ncbi:MAG: ROK family protein [Propionibacteriaceae bacterium]
MDPADDVVLAVDIGGTKIAVALVRADGSIAAETTALTAPVTDPEEVFAPAAAAICEVLGAGGAPPGRPLRVGIGSAGPIDGRNHTVSPVNIPGWRAYPIVERVTEVVRQATGTPPRVRLAGDGHCFALGEHWLGAGKDVSTMIGMVLSTGVGGGAVIDDELFTGTSGNAVHLGHISVNAWGPRCVCGCHGCTESYARGPALVAAARAQGWAGKDAQALTADARAGNRIAVDAIDYGMRALAAGIATTATELDITMVVLGGGVSKAGEVIFGPLRRHLVDFATLAYVQELEIRPAELENAGLLGAAALARTLTVVTEPS